MESPLVLEHTTVEGRVRTRIAPGIYKDRYGLAATVKVGDLPQKEKRFPPDTQLRQIKRWQDETRVALRQIAPRTHRGTLAADVRDYLARVKANHIDERAFKERAREAEAWLPRFGSRLRVMVAVHELDEQLWEWRKTLSAKTCNHRRTALGHLFVVLDGKSAKNPVRDTVKFDPPDPVPRAMPLEVIDQVLNALNDETKTQARLRLMRWTGMRPSQMGRLRLDSFHLDAGDVPHVIVPRGKKGRVVRVPFVGRAAVKAAKEFIRLCLNADAKAGGAFGSWSTTSANRLLTAACKVAGVTPFNLYRIKHSVGSRLRQVMDVADVQYVYGHTNSDTTEIYAEKVPWKIIDGFKHLTVKARRKRKAA